MAADPAPRITGVILAGGLARRMGGLAKGLQCHAGRPLIAHVIERLQPQVETLLLNVNREQAAHQAFGLPLVADRIADHPGPLAGLHAALAVASTPWVLSVPCDSPQLPDDLAHRLLAAAEAGHRPLAIAWAGERAHPVFCLCHVSLRDPLADFLQAGGRRVMQWCDDRLAARADFPDADAFANFNTLADLAP
jgi:molybdopterin-guanine dinucleotide biosynthesis protein A